MSSAPSRLMLRHNRVVARRTALRHASTTSEATQAVSKTAEKGKETASNMTSKASSGLSRVTSSAGSVMGGASQGVSNTVNRLGGRLGSLINFVQSMYPPTVYYSKVGLEVAKLVFQGQKMSPPSLQAFQSYSQPLINAIRHPASVFAETTASSAATPEGILSRLRNMDPKQLAAAGVIGAEILGFFTVGEMIGRMKLKSAPSSKKVQQHKIPSSLGGYVESHPSDKQAATLHATEQIQPRGIKRKRSEGTQHQISEPSVGLDYFENIKGASSSVEKPAKNEKHVSPIVNGHLETGAPTIEEDECRRILKRNKVKITLLKSDRDKEAEKKTASRGVNQAAQNKDTHPQLSPQPLISFTQLRIKYGISRRLAENLDAQGFRHPTEVQIGSLPLLLGSDKDRGLAPSTSSKKKKHKQSQVDLLTVAPTGSGKTLAFMVNILHGLLERRRTSRKSGAEKKEDRELQALVIAPTHELADQIVNEGRKLAVGTGIRVSSMRNGMKLHADPQNLEANRVVGSADEINDAQGEQGPGTVVKADILVSTPMILLNALKGGSSSPVTLLPTLRYLVLDEADVLLDPLFRSQTLGIWQACNNPELQTSLWSATIGSSIESLAQDTILDRRRNLKLSSTSHFLLRVVVGLKDSAIPNISHRLTYAATEYGKLLALRQLLHPSAPSDEQGPSLQPPFLIFTQTIQRAIALHSELLYDIPPEAGGSSRIAVLHSDLSDHARSAIMAGFRKGEIWVLITTDLLSRGIDFRGMNGVVNYDIPNTGASYVHRVGRTGRQGREGGVAVTLYTKEDIPYVKNIANVIAASEKAQARTEGSAEGGHNLQKWFLDALPSVSKKMKKELKRKGVESRRVFEGKEGGKMARRARISTKSGYDRRLENRRKGASTEGTKSLHGMSSNDETASDGEWGGLND